MAPRIVLPTTLSGLIFLALEDTELCAEQERYFIDSTRWHTPIRGVTHVCPAGAVMAQTLGAHPSQNCNPYFFGIENGRKLFAINSLRQGRVWRAANLLMPGRTDGKKLIEIEDRFFPNMPAVENYPEFKKRQGQLATALRKIGE